jgi:hypothetical protein
MDSAQIHLTSTQLRNASEAQILAGTDKWAKNEKFATAMLITHLAELSAKRLYRDRSHSMFAYCTDVLRLDPGCVWLRLQVANCCRKFPELLDEIARGSISLSVAALLAPHLTSENKSSLIAAFQHKTKREAEELLADLHPQAAARPGIRSCQIPLEGFPFTAVAYDHASHEMPVHAMTPPGEERAKIIPLGNQRYDLKFSKEGAKPISVRSRG